MIQGVAAEAFQGIPGIFRGPQGHVKRYQWARGFQGSQERIREESSFGALQGVSVLFWRVSEEVFQKI